LLALAIQLLLPLLAFVSSSGYGICFSTTVKPEVVCKKIALLCGIGETIT
jgi:hypothetical protein